MSPYSIQVFLKYNLENCNLICNQIIAPPHFRKKKPERSGIGAGKSGFCCAHPHTMIAGYLFGLEGTNSHPKIWIVSLREGPSLYYCTAIHSGSAELWCALRGNNNLEKASFHVIPQCLRGRNGPVRKWMASSMQIGYAINVYFSYAISDQ